MEALLPQLLQRVQELYDSVPGTPTQRDADRWLTAFVEQDGAWEVLLHVLENAAGATAVAGSAAAAQQPQQSQPTDVRLAFIATKMLQVSPFVEDGLLPSLLLITH